MPAKKTPPKAKRPTLGRGISRQREQTTKQVFEEARQAMVHAARLTFNDYREKHPRERFYAFALYADNYGHAICPAAHTEAAYEENLATNTAYKKSELGLLRYCPDEWHGDYRGTTRHADWSAVEDLLAPILSDDTLTWEQAARPVFEAMTACLADLDAEGVFGRGAVRDEITLMIWGRGRNELWAPSVERLNSAKVYKRFIGSGLPKSYMK